MNRQRLKIALVPVLGLVLYAVLRGESPQTEPPPAPRARRPEFPVAENAAPEAATGRAKLRHRELSEIVSFDPFTSPFAGPTGAGSEPADAAVRSAGAGVALGPLRGRLRIDAVMKRDGVYHAVIGGKVVRPGDVIDEGRYRVTAVTAHDVTFSRVDPE